MLVLACGSGRLTLPLAARGQALTALDNAPRMIALLRERLRAAGIGAGQVEPVLGDLNTFRLLPERHPECLAATMDHTYRITEIVGSSPNSIDEAIRNGLARATQTLRNVDWFEVSQIRGSLTDNQLGYFQVCLKVGFRLDEA